MITPFPDPLPSSPALSSLESVITSYLFFYRPKGLRLGAAWRFHPPREVDAPGLGGARGHGTHWVLKSTPSPLPALQTDPWRLSGMNQDFSLCPVTPAP